jgi:glycosyltransferase involved in cell wall biosynthesis
MRETRRPRLLVLVVAYNAEKTIQATVSRIPASLSDEYELEVLVIDDGSTDRTFDHGEAMRRAGALAFGLTILFNPVNQGYGGNQKIGFHYAIEHGFDFVALLHGNGEYAPESLPDLLAPLTGARADTVRLADARSPQAGVGPYTADADAVLGSRMLEQDEVRRRRMPLYKVLGNRVLTRLQNRLLRAQLSEFHCGYRVYSTAALRQIPFQLNSDGFAFDTEITIQLLRAGLRITELAIPTYSSAEIGPTNGIKYAWDVTLACVKARAQDLSLFYDRKFDCRPHGNAHYTSRLHFDSTHTMALVRIPTGSRVVDIGCAGGHLAHVLRERGCHTTGIDQFPLAEGCTLDEFRRHDLNDSPFPIDLAGVDYAVMLDVIEHLASPERFVDDFLAAAARNPDVKFIVSTGNVAFGIMRLMLLFSQFNYGKRGILDLTHLRLFTFGTFRRLFEQSGFRVLEMRGVPAPFPLALGDTRTARFLLRVNRALIALSRSLFAYQIFAVVQPKPALAHLLDRAQRESGRRAAAAASLDGPASTSRRG